ncbi:MAG TPA: PspC domain-containing protein [Verrucomicrobiae bacterium]|nr:PspC domain-containing protein [Verrucomicrobiae bacterium]
MSRRLYRSTSEKKIAGVCGGLAEYFDIDPVFVRLAAIVPLFLGVPTPLIYLVCWVVLPAAPAGGAAHGGVIEVTPDRPRVDGAALAGVAILCTGIVLLLLNTGVLDWALFKWWRWRYLMPGMLIMVGLLILAQAVAAHRGRQGNGGA